MTVTGRVMNGRLVVDEPTELPEGAVVALRLLDEETVAPASESATVDNGRVSMSWRPSRAASLTSV